MSDKLRISSSLAFPAEIAGRRTAVFGISGSGKSNTAAVLVESLLHAGEQVVCVDPKGEGWGLLSMASGKPSNLPVIVFGEPNGHIETLNEAHGPRLADFVVDTGRSVVLSLLGFESDQSERRFVATFLRQLYRRKSRQGKPTRTLVVLDEAHLFVPENVRGDAAELAGAAQRIARQGRTFGIGTLIIDQRPQDVSKRVITQCDTLICHQLVHKTDRDALREWVRGYDVDGRGEQFLESLASLEPGEAWVWSPGWLKVFKQIKVDRRKTYDSGASPDGSAGTRKVQRADVDLEALRGQLEEVVERAKENDPKALKAEVARLRKELGQAKAEARVEQVLVPDPELAQRLRDGIPALTAALNELNILLPGCEREKPKAEPAFREFDPNRHVFGGRNGGKTAATERWVQENPKAVVVGPHGTKKAGGRLSSGERKILTVLAQYPLGRTKVQVALLTGYAHSGGGFSNYLSSLRSRGLIENVDNGLRITLLGYEALGPFDPLPTGTALREHWLRECTKAEREILSVLYDTYPKCLTKEEIAERTESRYEPSGGGFNNAVSRLRSLELVEGRGAMKASDTFFE